MKKLKIDHDLAIQILKGDKWATWIIFDDQDLEINDKAVLVDEVDPDNARTWEQIGTATLSKIIEKRLGDASLGDMNGHGKYENKEQLIEELKDKYGDKVDLSTPIKIVHFDFMPHEIVDESHIADSFEHLIIYADGGSRGNPGPSASGFVLLDDKDAVVVDKGIYLGITTNNQAEYQSLKFALEEAQKLGAKRIDARMDSLLVINQMKGIFKVKNRDLWPIHAAIKKLEKQFKHVSYSHVPRELNKLADAAVNRALDLELGIAPRTR